MGFFDYIKQFFEKEKEVVIQNKTLDGTLSWIETSKKRAIKEIFDKLMPIREQISEEKEKTRQNIQKLEDAKIKNENIPAKAKHFMGGNRKTFVKRVGGFAEKINLPDSYSDLVSFLKNFDMEIDELGKSIARNYKILQEFFIDESYAVLKNTKEFDGLIKQVEKIINDSKIEIYNELHKKTTQIKENIQIQKDEDKSRILNTNKIATTQKEIAIIKQQIEEIKTSKDYKKFIELTKKKQLIKSEQINVTKAPVHSFSVIEAALKKYERMAFDEKLIRKYLDDPIKTLFQDSEFKILNVIEKMRYSIKSGELELKDKKRLRVLKELDVFSKDYFQKFFERYDTSEQKLTMVNVELKDIKITQEIEDLEKSLKQKETKVNETIVKPSTTKEINNKELVKDLENEIQSKLGQIIKINL